MRVIGFGTYDRSKHPRVGIVLDGLRAHGDDVFEVNAPLGFSTSERVAMIRSPWRALALAFRLLHRWLILARGRCAARGRIDAVVVGYLGHFDVLLARLLYPRTLVVLDLLIFGADTARDRGVRVRPLLWMFSLLDGVAAAAADLVLVDTEENVHLLARRHRHKALVVPVGSHDAWFGNERPRDTSTPLKIVFYGLFTPLQGTTVIAEALTKLPPGTAEVLMIGTGQEWELARDMAEEVPGTTWVDWMDLGDLREVVRRSDICLGIFGTSDKARRVVPNKVYQGAAAGCAVVTSDTAPQRRALADAALYVPPGDPDALASIIVDLAQHRDRLQEFQTRALVRARHGFGPSEVARPLQICLQRRGGPHHGRVRRFGTVEPSPAALGQREIAPRPREGVPRAS